MSQRPTLVETLETRSLMAVTIQFDYSLDTKGFFADTARRDLLNLAARQITERFTDTLSAITPSGSNTWKMSFANPATGSTTTINNPTIAANTIRIYAGGRDLPTGNLGVGGTSGFSASGNTTWFNTIRGRGNSGAIASSPTDFAPFGGTITFDTNANWHFGATTSGLTGTSKSDFLSVAIHELGHALGFGTAASFKRLISGSSFVGSVSKAANGNVNVPLASGLGHWKDGILSGGKETAMDPTIVGGTRKLLTPLDYAGFDDLGWTVAAPASIAGNVYKDLNGNGNKDTGEGAFGSVTLWIDWDKDGVKDAIEPTTLSDASGNYKFSNLGPGTYRVRQVTPSGWRLRNPIGGYLDVAVTAGQNVTGKNFAETQRSRISGTVFKDADGDRVKDSNESQLTNWRVFIDKNGDGKWQSATETQTALTDASGNWAFDGLVAGTYNIGIVLQTGWSRTTPTTSAGVFTQAVTTSQSFGGKAFGVKQSV